MSTPLHFYASRGLSSSWSCLCCELQADDLTNRREALGR